MAYVSKLSQSFERLHTLEEFDGAGISLAIVKWIVERRTGGEGATFSVTVGNDAVA